MKAEPLLYDLVIESVNPEHRLRLIRGAYACCVDARQWQAAATVTELIDNAPGLLLRDLPIEYAEWFQWLLVHGGIVVAGARRHCLRGGDTRGGGV